MLVLPNAGKEVSEYHLTAVKGCDIVRVDSHSVGLVNAMRMRAIAIGPQYRLPAASFKMMGCRVLVKPEGCGAEAILTFLPMKDVLYLRKLDLEDPAGTHIRTWGKATSFTRLLKMGMEITDEELARFLIPEPPTPSREEILLDNGDAISEAE